MPRAIATDFVGWLREHNDRMGKDERGRMAFTRIVLRPEIEWVGEGPDAEALARLHHAAHEACFIANSLRCEVVVE